MTQRTLLIRGWTGPSRPIRIVRERGVWAITPHQDDPGRYNVTHIPSGLGVFSGFNSGLTLTKALKALRACAEMPGDWSRPVESKKDLTPEQRAAGRAVQARFMEVRL